MSDFLTETNKWMEKLNPDVKHLNEVNRLRETDYKEHRLIRPINELKLFRILKHGENGYIIISANRSEIASSESDNDLTPDYLKYIKEHNINDTPQTQRAWLKKRNEECDQELSDYLRSSDSPYSFNPVYGGYHGKDNITDDFEPSFIVYNYTKKGEPIKNFKGLYDFALSVCAKYKQDSVLVCEPGKAPNHVNRHGQIQNNSSSKRYKFNKDNEAYYTTTKRDKGLRNGEPNKYNKPQRFTADIRYEGKLYHDIGPASYGEHMRRGQQGEYFLDENIMKTYEYEEYKKKYPHLNRQQIMNKFENDLYNNE